VGYDPALATLGTFPIKMGLKDKASASLDDAWKARDAPEAHSIDGSSCFDLLAEAGGLWT